MNLFDKDALIALMITGGLMLTIYLLQGCSVVSVQVATGSPATIDDPSTGQHTELNLKKLQKAK